MPTPRRNEARAVVQRRREQSRLRISALLLVTVVLFGTVALRLVHLQVIARDGLAAAAIDQRLVSFTIPAARGTIFDRNGRDLALDVPRDFVFVDPQLVMDEYRETYVDNLTSVLHTDAATIEQRLERATLDDGKPLRYRLLWNEPLSVDQARAIRTLALPGVALETRTVRVYPNGELAAPILGAAHQEASGLEGHAGIEATYDDLLTGESGRAEFERDDEGREIPHSRRERSAARRGSDLEVTLDASIQAFAERTLIDQVTDQQAKGGVAIVLDVHTGDILAMANVGEADDTGYAQLTGPTESNAAANGVFEPGSTNKVITVATALENQACGLTPDTGFSVPWRIVNGDRVIKDNSQHAEVWWTTRDILAKSSNVGTAKIAERCFTPESMDAALRNFGYGTPTALGLGEPPGIVTDPSQYYSTGLRSTAIGYGVAVTPLQILKVFATIANGGRTVHPRLVAASIAPDGARTELEIAPGRRVLQPETAATMAELLLGVVAEGTAPCASITGYEVAGKTGTSRKVGAHGGYVTGLTTASFVGFAPAMAPELATIVVIDEPGKDIVGGAAAAPVFSEIMRFALTHRGVAPTAPSTEPTQWDAAATAHDDHASACAVPHGASVEVIPRGSGDDADADAAPSAEVDLEIFAILRDATVDEPGSGTLDEPSADDQGA